MRWLHAALLAAAAAYAGQLAPFVAGPLTECGHCVQQYAKLYAVLPGVVPAMLLQLKGGTFFAVAAIGTAAVFTAVAALLRILPPRGRGVVLAAAAITLGGWALAFSYALRA